MKALKKIIPILLLFVLGSCQKESQKLDVTFPATEWHSQYSGLYFILHFYPNGTMKFCQTDRNYSIYKGIYITGTYTRNGNNFNITLENEKIGGADAYKSSLTNVTLYDEDTFPIIKAHFHRENILNPTVPQTNFNIEFWRDRK